MHRHHWTSSLFQTSCPPWECPICGTGRVVLRPGTVLFEETVESKRLHGEDYWGPEHIELIFNAWADCNNARCKQPFAIGGYGGIEQFFDERAEDDTWEECFTPTFVKPSPKIIALPAACPPAVKDLFHAAFQMYWPDAEACAGKIRSVVEALLTHLGIATVDATDPTNPKRLTLHRRIELLEKTHPEQSRLLMAIKWMGNSGSRETTYWMLLNCLNTFCQSCWNGGQNT
jgi:hypothetical protein